MDGSTLNVSAPVFQPGGGTSIGSAFTSRQPFPLQMLPMVSESSQYVDPHHASAVQPFQSATLAEIQNQMAPGGGVPGGMVSMSANSRPFVPGGVGSAGFKPQIPPTHFQHGPSPITTSPSRSPIPGYRLGHGMNPGSVQLTGLPAFLATAPLMTTLPQPSGFAGPPSPLSPGTPISASPFMMPPGQPNLAVPHPGAFMRKGKGLQPVTPLKTFGHNSTPSISMNPAAFAASLAAIKPKKKVTISFPSEQPRPEDEQLLVQQKADRAHTGAKDGDEPAPEPSNADAVKRRHARAAALTRQKWIKRVPLSPEEYDLVPCMDAPPDAFVTCEIHPEPWPYFLGLPDTIEIYLPGMSAWDEYWEMRLEEQQLEAEAAAAAAAAAAEQAAFSSLPRPKALLPSQLPNLDGDHKGRSLSISHPADANMVSYKLNRFLQSQQAIKRDSSQLTNQEKTDAPENAPRLFGRLPLELPNRLREAFARRRGESVDVYLTPQPKHGHTMSLGLPSSGGPFGPEVFSALNMIRANSDEGPSKPPSETHDMPDKPLSDSEATFGRSQPALPQIAEDDVGEQFAESAVAAAAHGASKSTGSGSWKDLGRGFGYDFDPEGDLTARKRQSKHHARQGSRVSVSTSRRGGDDCGELLEDDDDIEIRTNPSEDADASDFEEDDQDFGPEHWHKRRSSAHMSAFGDHGDYDDLSDGSGSLRDSLTPSDEQFSNPSDEEAAREERILRRQHRAAERAARQERKARQRARADTNNTLPSSSIGEADLLEQSRYDFGRGDVHHRTHEILRRAQQDDIVSNPSDEALSDMDDTQTFGHSDRPWRHDDGSRMSQDFRFPSFKPMITTETRSGHVQPKLGTLGRASGISMLNPDAKEFKFGGNATASRTVSAPVASSKDTGVAPEAGHFRLPSIKTSSFGSALGMPRSGSAPHLNVAAPAFTPSAFTFQAPDGVRLPLPEKVRVSSNGGSPPLNGDQGDQAAEDRELQGREKRTRYGPIDYASEEDHLSVYGTSPPRPKASAASIEGPMRGFSSLARHGPPPFLPRDFSQQQRAISHGADFTADAPSFVPSWAGGAQAFGGSASFKRPMLPDWGLQEREGVQQKEALSIRDPSFFAVEQGSKAIPIRHPSETGQSETQQDKLTVDSPVASSAISADNGAKRTAQDLNQTSTETVKPWNRTSHAQFGSAVEKSKPVQIASVAHNYQSSIASFASDAAAGPTIPSVRWGDRNVHSPSRSSYGMSSIDRRLRRADQRHRHGGDDDDDESLIDFVEEIAERLDKALEGWAGKILDEVTIMGQVRPLPRGSLAGPDGPLDQDKIIHEISRHMEQVLDAQLATTFSGHARKATDASDETQATIRPVTRAVASTNDKLDASGLGLVDAAGEWDFDYVQEALDAKLGSFYKQIESTMSRVVEKLEARDGAPRASGPQSHQEGANGSAIPPDFVEDVTTRLVKQLGSLLESHITSAREAQTAAEKTLQDAVQAKLDENLVLLSEKGAADRSNLQQMLEAEIHDLGRSLLTANNAVQDQVQSALKEALPPLLEEKARNDASLFDKLSNQITDNIGAALGPALSEQRRCLLEDGQRSRDHVSELLPSASQIAKSTVKLVEPLISSLKTDPIDSDTLVTKLAEMIGKQSIEHMVDLNPVLALLEPLVAKQEDARSASKKILQMQEDTERTLSELPSAINAKTEVFLSSAGETADKQRLILEKIAEIQAGIKDQPASGSPIGLEKVMKKLEELSQSKKLVQSTSEKTLSELAAVYQVLDSSYQALSRLEAQHTSTEEAHRELTSKLEKQAQANANLSNELREAEKRAVAAEAGNADLFAQASSADKQNAILKEQLAQMAAELARLKSDQANERKSSTKAIAEANGRAQKAEAAKAENEKRLTKLLEQANVAEREAYESAKSTLERASKAEGQVTALEKRVAELDAKVANLQGLTAAQKQKAATTQQKLAEGDKRIKELERGLEDKEAMETRLQESQVRESRLRDELQGMGTKFAQLESELLGLKDNFVEKGMYEDAIRRLQEREGEVARLKAQVSAVGDGWETVDVPRGRKVEGAWASMHAPKKRAAVADGDSSREKLVSTRSVSFASTASRGKEVEVDEGGWWS